MKQPAIITRLKPYWKVFAAISMLSLCLASLIALEDIFLLAAELHRSKFAISRLYLLSWTVIIVACVSAGIGIFLHYLEDPDEGSGMRSRWITPATITRFKPYWKVFVVIAVLTVFLTAVIVFENIFFLSTALNQNPLLLFLPYPLSWILIAAACTFGRIACLLHGTTSKSGAVRHVSPSIWSGDGSRPVTPNSVFYSTQSLGHERLSVSHNSQVFLLPHGTNYAPQSPFCIEEGVSRNVDHPPSYAEAVRSSHSN